MIFKKSTTFEVDSPRHQEIAQALEAGISELLRTTPELTKHTFHPGIWQMSDKHDSTAENANTDLLFEEFASHDLTPTRLHFLHMGWSDKDRNGRYSLSCHYTMGRRLSLNIEGSNRLIVDGIGATLERMAERIRSIAKRTDAIPATDQPPSLTAAVNESWIKRTWRDHTTTAVVTLVVGVVVLAVGAWLGWN